MKTILFGLCLLLTGCCAAKRPASPGPTAAAMPDAPPVTPPAWVIYPAEKGGQGVKMEEWLQQNRMDPGEEISLHDVSRSETASTHIVQIRKLEALHVHEHHDLVVVVQKGHGLLKMGTQELRLVPGSVVTIPRGVPHSFVNESPEPAVAFVVFSPAFDGRDTVPVE